MRSGPARHRFSLQEQRVVPDGYGGNPVQWVEVRKVWGEVVIPTGRIAPVADQLTATVDAEIRIRFTADAVAGRRLVRSDVVYLIEAPLPDNNRSLLRLLCSSVPHP